MVSKQTCRNQVCNKISKQDPCELNQRSVFSVTCRWQIRRQKRLADLKPQIRFMVAVVYCNLQICNLRIRNMKQVRHLLSYIYCLAQNLHLYLVSQYCNDLYQNLFLKILYHTFLKLLKFHEVASISGARIYL